MATPLSPRVVFSSRVGCWSLLGLLILVPSLCWWLVMLGPHELTEPDDLRPSTPLPLYTPPSYLRVPPLFSPPPLRYPAADSDPGPGYEWVRAHQQGSKWVDGYWRRRTGYWPPVPPASLSTQ